MISRLLSSGRMPAKKPRHSLRLKRSFLKGNDWDRGVAPGFLQPALRVVEDHLAAVILDEVADEFIVQIDIEGSCHALLFFRGTSPAASAPA